MKFVKKNEERKFFNKLSLHSSIPWTTCQKVLKKELQIILQPYRIIILQELKLHDPEESADYCN